MEYWNNRNPIVLPTIPLFHFFFAHLTSVISVLSVANLFWLWLRRAVSSVAMLFFRFFAGKPDIHLGSSPV
jgi:hypothetical protein